MKIKLNNFISLVAWLRQLPLSSEMSKERSRFVKLAEPHLNDLFLARMKLLNEYAKKGENGELIMLDMDGRKEYDIPPGKKKEAEDKYAELLNAELDIPIEGNKSKLQSIKEILKTTSFEFSGKLADEYLEWAIAFDQLSKYNAGS